MVRHKLEASLEQRRREPQQGTAHKTSLASTYKEQLRGFDRQAEMADTGSPTRINRMPNR